MAPDRIRSRTARDTENQGCARSLKDYVWLRLRIGFDFELHVILKIIAALGSGGETVRILYSSGTGSDPKLHVILKISAAIVSAARAVRILYGSGSDSIPNCS